MENSDRTRVCSVLFLDIVGYSKESVADQSLLKQMFNSVLSAALEAVPSRDRIILDTGDGAAVTFLGDPEDALFAALAIRNDPGGLPIRIGVNLGAVRLVKDLNGQVNVIGDGINVAQRVMSFAEPDQLLVSRSFYEVASCLSADYANLFTHEGSRTDKHVRLHEVYSVAAGMPAGQRSARTQAGQGPQRSAISVVDVQTPEDEELARQPAEVFDAGGNLIISGYSKSSVQAALNTLEQSGSRVISPIARVGKKWMAACEHPQIAVSACKVEQLGNTLIVTGPTQEAVSAKVEELMGIGARVVREIERTGDIWTAVCEARGY
jgi:class 3 adenylate cyclase